MIENAALGQHFLLGLDFDEERLRGGLPGGRAGFVLTGFLWAGGRFSPDF